MERVKASFFRRPDRVILVQLPPSRELRPWIKFFIALRQLSLVGAGVQTNSKLAGIKSKKEQLKNLKIGNF